MDANRLAIKPEQRGTITVRAVRKFMAGRHVAGLSQPRKWHRLTVNQLAYIGIGIGVVGSWFGLMQLLSYLLQ